jgi:hypothetical protein
VSALQAVHPEVPVGEHSYRITWIPGQDRMLGICHCGAEQISEDPIELWLWLLGHPDGHHPVNDPS